MTEFQNFTFEFPENPEKPLREIDAESGEEVSPLPVGNSSVPAVISKAPVSHIGPITENEIVQVVSYIEQRFWEHGIIPTDEKICQDMNMDKNRWQLMKSLEFYEGMIEKRGIQLSADLLTPKQIVMANMLCNLHDKASIRQHCEALSISPQQFSAWQRDPAFNRYLQKRMEFQFENSGWVADKTLLQAINRGDISATKLYYEMIGRYNPKLNVQIDINSYTTKIIEVITKHVTSIEVIDAIAQDLEAIG